MSLTVKTAESAAGVGAPDAVEGGGTLDAVEEAAGATPATQVGGVTFAQLQQLLNQQAAVTGRMMRELQADMQDQISGAIERLEDRADERSDDVHSKVQEAAGSQVQPSQPIRPTLVPTLIGDEFSQIPSCLYQSEGGKHVGARGVWVGKLVRKVIGKPPAHG